MADNTGILWGTCNEDDCIGVVLPTGARCWAHAAEDDLRRALERLTASGELDARGVAVTSELLKRLLAAATKDDKGAVLVTAAFDRATFHGATDLTGVTFHGVAGFDGATFQDSVRFDRATFHRGASFDHASFDGFAGFARTTFQVDAGFFNATFRGGAQFRGATFHPEALFGGASFHGVADFQRATFHASAGFSGGTFHVLADFSDATFQGVGFEGATFHDTAWFTGATFHRGVVFDRATFRGWAWFRDATFDDAYFVDVTFQVNAVFDRATFRRDVLFHSVTFHGPAKLTKTRFLRSARFSDATFEHDTDFTAATFQHHARFDGTTFRQTRRLGPLLARRGLVLDATVFHVGVIIEVSAAVVCCRRARFLAGVQLRARQADIAMDDAELSAPSIISGGHIFQDLDDERWGRAMDRLKLWSGRAPALYPRLVSLRRADVAGLTAARVDLCACRFTDAHHLDQLRLGAGSDFAGTPRNRRWTTRRTIAEEHDWRRRQTRLHADRGWYGPDERAPTWLSVGSPDLPPWPGEIAELYRSLRKGREDSKDEPGAADFYYGEMEMRRHDLFAPRAERLVLTLYWLFSGYGLRASRAITWLLGILLTATTALAAGGLDQTNDAANGSFPARLGTAALTAIEGAVFRAAEQDLTYTGRLIQVALRITGPILLALAVISIRGRVKR